MEVISRNKEKRERVGEGSGAELLKRKVESGCEEVDGSGTILDS